jgi:hypothetical protein
LEADKLTRFASEESVAYDQRDSKQPTDEANPKKGSDGSREIWYLFNKTGLRYNESNRFLPTTAMVGANSPMNLYFENCNKRPYQIGDILVYRDTGNSTGHTVILIDPDQSQRIAWGSRNYDNSAPQKSGHKPNVGVEYQKLMSRADWKRLDKADMRLKQCWRYRRFSEELKQPGGGPGLQALSKPCETAYCIVN